MEDKMGYLQEGIKGLIVWLNRQTGISQSEREDKIQELIADLDYTGGKETSSTCHKFNLSTGRTCGSSMNLFVDTSGNGTWICPVCSNTKKAVQIQGVWFEELTGYLIHNY